MPSFSYKAAKRDGAVVEGTIEAQSETAVSRELRAQGLVVVSIRLAKGEVKTVKRGSFDKKQVLAFTHELAVLLRAGLPIDRALKVLIDMSASAAARAVLDDVLATVKGGKGLSQALEAKPHLFDDFYISMVRSGEASGNLAEVLNRLALQLESARQIRNGVVSALIYPAILAVVAVISVLVMLGFVVPQFEALFEDMGEALPVITQLVISGGELIQSSGIYLVIFLGAAVWVGKWWFSTLEGKTWLDQRILRIPILGGVIFKYEVAKFAKTMGTLLDSGVSLLKSLQIAVSTVGNTDIRTALDALAPEVKRGGRISNSLSKAGKFSPMMVQMIRVGEESGQLGSMMQELAKVYDDEVSSGIKRSLTLLEPILILGMGGMIGFIIVAILMGILSVNDLAV